MPQPATAKVTITLNGDPYTIEGDPSLPALLGRLNMRTMRVAVEINHRVIPKAAFADTIVRTGDEVEIINFVGGG
jgi:sulfur carrier protein